MRRLYRFLLWLHPFRFRARFGEEMLFTFDAERGSGGRCWLVADGLVSLFRQRAFPAAPARRELRRRLWSMSKVLASGIFLLWLFTNHVAKAMATPTESMSPTVLRGDHFVLDRLGFPASLPREIQPFMPRRTIQRGAIIVFRWPVDPGISFVKRVIGLPGDRLEVRGKDIFINGVILNEPYREISDRTVAPRGDYGPIVVPPHSYFVMGDNRTNSLDSRDWGFVPENDIEGTPLFVYWSYDSAPAVSPTAATTWMDRVRSLAAAPANFIERTRWSRTGAPVR